MRCLKPETIMVAKMISCDDCQIEKGIHVHQTASMSILVVMASMSQLEIIPCLILLPIILVIKYTRDKKSFFFDAIILQ